MQVARGRAPVHRRGRARSRPAHPTASVPGSPSAVRARRSRSPTPRRRAAPPGRPARASAAARGTSRPGARSRRVVRRRAVGAEPDRDPAGPHRRVREDPPDRELEVRHGVRDDGRAALGDELEVSGSSIHTPWARIVRGPSTPRRSRYAAGRSPVRSKTPGHLVLDLEEVEVDRDVARRGLLGDPRQRLVAHGVDPVRRRATSATRGPTSSSASSVAAASARDLATARRIHPVDQWEPDRRSQTRVVDGPGHRVRLPVHVPERGPCRCGSSRRRRVGCPSTRRRR